MHYPENREGKLLKLSIWKRHSPCCRTRKKYVNKNKCYVNFPELKSNFEEAPLGCGFDPAPAESGRPRTKPNNRLASFGHSQSGHRDEAA